MAAGGVHAASAGSDSAVRRPLLRLGRIAGTLHERLEDAGAEIIEGPVEREGGRQAMASSVYVRDPDENLLEFMIYPKGTSDAG